MYYHYHLITRLVTTDSPNGKKTYQMYQYKDNKYQTSIQNKNNHYVFLSINLGFK